jgi:hypothetical protein
MVALAVWKTVASAVADRIILNAYYIKKSHNLIVVGFLPHTGGEDIDTKNRQPVSQLPI